jgi:hypothetical protein
MLITKNNQDDLITIEYSKGTERSYQTIKRRQYLTIKMKLESIGYTIKLIEKNN